MLVIFFFLIEIGTITCLIIHSFFQTNNTKRNTKDHNHGSILQGEEKGEYLVLSPQVHTFLQLNELRTTTGYELRLMHYCQLFDIQAMNRP